MDPPLPPNHPNNSFELYFSKSVAAQNVSSLKSLLAFTTQWLSVNQSETTIPPFMNSLPTTLYCLLQLTSPTVSTLHSYQSPSKFISTNIPLLLFHRVDICSAALSIVAQLSIRYASMLQDNLCSLQNTSNYSLLYQGLASFFSTWATAGTTRSSHSQNVMQKEDVVHMKDWNSTKFKKGSIHITASSTRLYIPGNCAEESSSNTQIRVETHPGKTHSSAPMHRTIAERPTSVNEEEVYTDSIFRFVISLCNSFSFVTAFLCDIASIISLMLKNGVFTPASSVEIRSTTSLRQLLHKLSSGSCHWSMKRSDFAVQYNNYIALILARIVCTTADMVSTISTPVPAASSAQNNRTARRDSTEEITMIPMLLHNFSNVYKLYIDSIMHSLSFYDRASPLADGSNLLPLKLLIEFSTEVVNAAHKQWSEKLMKHSASLLQSIGLHWNQKAEHKKRDLVLLDMLLIFMLNTSIVRLSEYKHEGNINESEMASWQLAWMLQKLSIALILNQSKIKLNKEEEVLCAETRRRLATLQHLLMHSFLPEQTHQLLAIDSWVLYRAKRNATNYVETAVDTESGPTPTGAAAVIIESIVCSLLGKECVLLFPGSAEKIGAFLTNSLKHHILPVTILSADSLKTDDVASSWLVPYLPNVITSLAMCMAVSEDTPTDALITFCQSWFYNYTSIFPNQDGDQRIQTLASLVLLTMVSIIRQWCLLLFHPFSSNLGRQSLLSSRCRQFIECGSYLRVFEGPLNAGEAFAVMRTVMLIGMHHCKEEYIPSFLESIHACTSELVDSMAAFSSATPPPSVLTSIESHSIRLMFFLSFLQRDEFSSFLLHPATWKLLWPTLECCLTVFASPVDFHEQKFPRERNIHEYCEEEKVSNSYVINKYNQCIYPHMDAIAIIYPLCSVTHDIVKQTIILELPKRFDYLLHYSELCALTVMKVPQLKAAASSTLLEIAFRLRHTQWKHQLAIWKAFLNVLIWKIERDGLNDASVIWPALDTLFSSAEHLEELALKRILKRISYILKNFEELQPLFVEAVVKSFPCNLREMTLRWYVDEGGLKVVPGKRNEDTFRAVSKL